MFCVLQELIFAIRTALVFPARDQFLRFSESSQYQALLIFSFLLSTAIEQLFKQWTSISLYNVLFLNERNKLWLNRHDFSVLLSVFLCSELKLENIYSGVHFCGKNVCGKFHLRELIFLRIAGKMSKSQKIGAHKNFVPHGSQGRTCSPSSFLARPSYLPHAHILFPFLLAS